MENHIEQKGRIEIQNLTFRYGQEKALQGVTASLNSPKIYGLIGRNGAGKTTLLSLIAAFRESKKGLLVLGENPYENPRVMEDVSYHGKPNFEEETEKVGDFIKMVRRYRPKFEMNRARKLLKDFEIPLDKPLNKLSQGKQSAVNGILGLTAGTSVTLLDEVYLGMDAPSRERFYKEILAEQMRRPRMMILSTHLVSEMDYLFDHVLILDNGAVILDAPMDEVLEKGYSVTGEKSKVQKFTKDCTLLHREELGPTQKAVVFGSLSREEIQRGEEQGLSFGEIPLQELFIHLTEPKGKEKSFDKGREEE